MNKLWQRWIEFARKHRIKIDIILICLLVPSILSNKGFLSGWFVFLLVLVVMSLIIEIRRRKGNVPPTRMR